MNYYKKNKHNGFDHGFGTDDGFDKVFVIGNCKDNIFCTEWIQVCRSNSKVV